jgi:hypothetical protein
MVFAVQSPYLGRQNVVNSQNVRRHLAKQDVDKWNKIVKNILMKYYFFLILISLNTSFLFCQEKGIIFTENLRIRNNPSLNADIINTRSCCAVTIYDKSGTKEFKNGIFDYWYKISENENQWVNAFYVAIFPIFFNFDVTVNGKDYKILNMDNSGIMDYYILDKGNVSIMQKDNALYNNIKDNPYLRLSELLTRQYTY